MHSNAKRLVIDQVTKVHRQLKREEWKSIIRMLGVNLVENKKSRL